MAQPAYTLNTARFDALRKTTHTSLKAWALDNGVTYSTIRKARLGRDEMSMHVVGRIADAFPGVSFEYLFTRNTATCHVVDEYADLRVAS
jgi:hypothetical protein